WQQHGPVKFNAGEFCRRRPGIWHAGHSQLFRPCRATIAIDVTARVQLHLRPDTTRIERDFYTVENLPSTTFSPEVIICRMGRYQLRQVGFLLACRAAGRETVDKTVLIPPVTWKEVAGDAAVISAATVKVRQSVMGGNARERWRSERTHKPLQHAEI